MRIFVLPLLAIGLVAKPCAAGAQHRELGAHEHGRGSLDIAVEGMRLSMEFRAPGADLVGFEHPAKTRRQKAAVDKARKQLLAPQALFQFPASAGCVVEEAKVAIESEGHDHDHAKEQQGASGENPREAGKKTADHDEDAHSEFHAQYAFNCKIPASITAIEFGYFRVFAGAQKLDVNLVTAKGQTKFEVARAKPRIDLAGQM